MKNNGKGINILKKDRGAIFLETALVLPLFMLVLCLCVDIPRILQVKQRLGGAGRMVAEIRARNQGNLDQLISENDLRNFFFDTGSQHISLHIDDSGYKYSMIGGLLNSIQDWIKDFLGNNISKVVKFLINFITAGNLEPYIINVFNKDKFYEGSVSADLPTVLPADFYNGFESSSPSTKISSPYTSYMPGCDSCKFTGKSFIQDVMDWLHNHFSF